MAEKITIEAEETPPAPTPPSDRTIDMAVEFGQLRATYQQTAERLAAVEMSQSRMLELLQRQAELSQAAISQANRAEDRAETAQEVAVATAAEVAESQNENEGALLEVTPPMETKIEIEQKPATNRGMLSRLIFGP